MTANPVFTVTLSVYLLVINPTNAGVSRLILREGAQSGAPLRESIEQDYLSKNVKKISFWGV